jgi:hypothetical protein
MSTNQSQGRSRRRLTVYAVAVGGVVVLSVTVQ